LARLIYSDQALADLERLADFLVRTSPAAAARTIGLIIEALSILSRHPCIGRAIEASLHELVISRGRTGYIALYRADFLQDAILILSIRHQREAGYPGLGPG